MKKRLFKIARVSLVSITLCFITLNVFEVVYRYNWIDFYKSELNALNPEKDLNLEKEKTILIFGDSFTANSNSWVNVLRDSLQNFNIINSAIPGTSVFQQNIFFESRIDQYNPDQIIIQLYVGNDLIDYDRPTNWAQQSILKNAFWSVSDIWISIQYLNYKLGYFKSGKDNGKPKEEGKFNPESYNHRTVNYINSDPNIIQHSINASGNMKKEMDELMIDLNQMIFNIDIPISIILIPHCSQVNEYYSFNMKELGAILDPDQSLNYGFMNQMEKELISDEKIRIYNCLPTLINNDSESSRMYYFNDPHLNKAGQLIIGGFILRNLKSNL